MHIGFRTSGGRGEYELVGSQSGYTASSLEGWSLYLAWPDGLVRDTGLWLDPGDSGKPRLRSLMRRPIQIGRIVASMLMLPDPVRTFKATPTSLPVAVAKKYSVTQVGFAPSTEFAEVVGRVTVVPSWVELANQGDTEAIGVDARWQRIQKVYGRTQEFSPNIASLVQAHRDTLSAGEIVDSRLYTVVQDMGKALTRSLGSAHVDGEDPLLTLEMLLDIEPVEEPLLPPPNELSEDELEINIRSAHQYRLARIRGTSGRRFSQLVRTAYRHTCAFCGAAFGGYEGIRSGIDAAHILAWSKHDLDVVSNGIALCKLHHWAFDAGLLLVRREPSGYVTRFSTLADRLDRASTDRIGTDGFLIPDRWLPGDDDERPSPHYLKLAYADLGVTFRDSA